MRSRLLATSCLLALILPGRGSSDPPSPPAKRSMSELVAALGADDPQSRDVAQAEIPTRVWDWTPEDVQLLEEATRSKDAEVAARAKSIFPTVHSRLRLAKAVVLMKDWDKAAVLEGSYKTRADLMRAVFEAWTTGAVSEDAWPAVSELALEEMWIGPDTEAFVISMARKNGSSPYCRGQIVRLCDSKDVLTASMAASAAAWFDFREAVPAICRAIERVDEGDLGFTELERAAATLEVASDATLMKHLSECESAHARMACAQIIQWEFATERAGLLSALIADPDRRVRNAAIPAVCQFGRPEHLDGLLKSLTCEGTDRLAVDLSRYRGKFDAAVFEGMMESRLPELRMAAAGYLRWANEPQSLLERGMGDREPLVRLEAAISAGFATNLKSVPTLIALLQDELRGVRTAAAVSLGRLRSAEALPLLRELAKSRKEGDGVQSLLGLATFGDPSTVPDLLEAIRGEKFPVVPEDQADARQALGLIGGAEAMARLRGLNAGNEARLVLEYYGEPEDKKAWDTAVPGVPELGWLLEQWELSEDFGVMLDDLPACLRGEKEIKPAGLFAANARFATGEQATDELLRLLQTAAQADDGCADDALIALVALGKTSVDQQKRLLRRVRTSNSWKIQIALCDALARAHEPDAWAAWTREAPMEREVRSAAAFIEVAHSRGIELLGSEGMHFDGRIAKGHVTSLRRVRHRLGLEGCAVFDGPKLRFLPEAEALRWWSDRLDR